MPNLFATDKRDGDLQPSQLKHRKYMALNLTILDEFGYQTMSREEANLFFGVVNYRYQKGSIALTTTKGITSWPELLAGDEVLAGATLDRLLRRGAKRIEQSSEAVRQQKAIEKKLELNPESQTCPGADRHPVDCNRSAMAGFAAAHG